ncbi:hypothetical protein P7C73_g565, partial [Tremellales sp. Uapishka_1]
MNGATYHPRQKRRPSSHAIPMPLTSSHLPSSLPRPIRRPRKIIYLFVIFFGLYYFFIRHGLGLERIPPPPLGFAVPGGRRRKSSVIDWARNGMAVMSSGALPAGQIPEHPIYELMEQAEERWTALLASQSKTLEAAVANYRKRYQMAPPLGFDKWFAFCQENDVRIVDEYDLMMKDLLPHHALEPKMFIQRSNDLEGSGFTYTLDISKDNIELTGERAANARPGHLLNLIDGFKRYLPDGFHVKATGSDHDTGSTVLGKDQRSRANELTRMGERESFEDGRVQANASADFDELELKELQSPHRTTAWGWFKACPLDSAANIRPGSENATDAIMPKSFIYNHLPTMDYCDFPELKRLHGAMHIDYEDRSPSILKPVMVLSKFPGDASFQTTPMEAYTNFTTADVPLLGTWEDKTDNRLFWRGSTTGGYNVHRDWKESHRMRLHLMVNGPKGGDVWWEKEVREIMVPNGEAGFKNVRRWARVLSKAYVDVKLAGSPVQCPTPELCKQVADTIEFGDRVWPDQASAFKYNLDVDGNGWSSRFHRLLSSGSPVIKMTMFPEWHQNWLTPWYHYIPLKPDYEDLYDTMAFFIGPVDDDGVVDETKGHDHLARKIGEAGQKFALENWRWQDMQAYMFRLLLELQRLQTLDREAASYKAPVVVKG